MATAVKRGDSYKITASCGYDISGKQIRKHTTWTPPAGMTPRQIAKELERQKVLFEERVNSGTTKDGNIRFEDFAAIWMKDFAQKQLKVKTYTGYEKSLVRINQAIGHIKLKDLRTCLLYTSPSLSVKIPCRQAASRAPSSVMRPRSHRAVQYRRTSSPVALTAMTI